MSERGGVGGAGVFLLGIAVGAVLGLLFAPGTGETTRAQVGRRLRDLRQLAGEKADELEELVTETEDDEEAGEDTARATREDFERRLGAARDRRRRRRAPKAETRDDGDDEPNA